MFKAIYKHFIERDPQRQLKRDIVNLLQEHGIGKDYNEYNETVDEVLRHGSIHGADVALKDLAVALMPVSSFHLAIIESEEKGLSFMKENTFDTEDDSLGDILRVAVLYRRPRCIKELVRRHNMSSPNTSLGDALHLAAANNECECAVILIDTAKELEIDLAVVLNSDGYPPWYIAEKNKHMVLARYLLTEAWDVCEQTLITSMKLLPLNRFNFFVIDDKYSVTWQSGIMYHVSNHMKKICIEVGQIYFDYIERNQGDECIIFGRGSAIDDIHFERKDYNISGREGWIFRLAFFE